MSISQVNNFFSAIDNKNIERSNRIISEVLSISSDSRLRGKIFISALESQTIQIVFIPFRESIKVIFGDNYPNAPPTFRREKSLFESIITQSNTIDSWTPESQLIDIIVDVYANMKNFTESQNRNQISFTILENQQQLKRKDSKDSSGEGTKRKVMMNGCADNQLTETKNLNRHFRSKLRQVYSDIVKNGSEAPQNAKWIESSFTLPRVGFEDISKVLKNEWFNVEVNKQMENGKFMHKIMKGMMSIKSKKLMVKYYHVMLAAAKDPDNFVKWKYQ